MIFSINFCEYVRMENQGNKNKSNERKYLENMCNNQFLRVKKILFEN